jgi:ribose transport system substrate-binding protein
VITLKGKASPRPVRRLGLTLTIGLAIGSVALVAAACSTVKHTSLKSHITPKVRVAHYTIGYSNPEGTQPVLNNFGEALTYAAAREGIRVISLNAALSVSKQVSDIQQFINDKVKAIVVFPLAGPPLIPVLTAARKAGIVVLGYNAVTNGAKSASAIYPYNADINQGIIHEGASEAAAYMVKQLHGKGNVLGVDIAAPVPSLHAFIAAEKADVTNGHPGIHWLETVSDVTDDIAGAAGPVADALTKYHDDIQGVMAYFDGAAIGAAQALKAAGVKAVITGQQGNSTGVAAVRNGEISATINLKPYDQAVIALAMIRDLLAGKSKMVPLVVHPAVTLVTKSNLKQYVPWRVGLSEVKSGKILPPTKIKAHYSTP